MERGTITYKCEQCGNDKFKIIKTLVHANFKMQEGNYSRAGRYRCMCTVCGLIQTFTSKNPLINKYGN